MFQKSACRYQHMITYEGTGTRQFICVAGAACRAEKVYSVGQKIFHHTSHIKIEEQEATLTYEYAVMH